MLATRVRYYLDENMQVAIAEQLTRRGIDVVTARDANQLGAEDVDHLRRATEEKRVLCTNDADYIEIATSGIQHGGIVFGQQEKHTIGIWVAFLARLHNEFTLEELANSVEYVRTL